MPYAGTLLSGSLPLVAAMPNTSTEALTLEGATVVHTFFELNRDEVLGHLPKALTTTIPASLYITGWAVPDSPFGAFKLAQVRVGARAGLRGRGLLAGAVTDSERVARELEARWGFRCAVGAVDVTRSGESGRIEASKDGNSVLSVEVGPLERLTGVALQWPASLHAADIASEAGGPWLIQVDPEYEFEAAWRGRPALDTFVAEAWNLAGVHPTLPIGASVATVRIQLPRLRFLVDPEGDVFDSGRKVGAGSGG